MLKAIKIRIYPNKEQTQFINKQLGSCRFVYNECLAYKTNTYKEEKVSISPVEVISHLVVLKERFPFLKEVHSKVLQQTIRDLNQAYTNFFKNGNGFPKFKSKKDNRQSCRFPKDAFIGINGNRISLIKALKNIHFKCSRKDERYLNKRQEHIHNITLIKTCSGKFFLSVLVDFEPEIKETTGSVIGLDLGIKDFIIDSNGNRFEKNNFFKKTERRLKHLNRQFSKKKTLKTGKQVFSKKWNKMVDETIASHNKEKLRKRIAKLYEKITNQRLNYIHQLTSQLVNENQIICVENLNVNGMIKNHKLAKHIQDAGFNEFIRVLEYKCKLYGRELVKIDRWFPSSKKCNHCGYINKELRLSDRQWICPECGSVIDRDYNAALNILEEGMRIYLERKK